MKPGLLILPILVGLSLLVGCAALPTAAQQHESPTADRHAPTTPRQTGAATYSSATYIGRWAAVPTPSGTAMTALSNGSRVRSQFTGTSFVLRLFVPQRTFRTEIEWSLDGGEWHRAPISPTMTLAKGLRSGTHTLDLYLAGTFWQDQRWAKRKGLSILGFRVDPTATVRPWPTGNRYKMLTIGDSIGEGEVALGWAYQGERGLPANWADNPSQNLPQFCTARGAPGNLLGSLIGADNSQFCFGGASIVGTEGWAALPGMYRALPYAMRGVEARDPVYDLVLLECVNNDDSKEASSFRTAYSSVVDRIHSKWPRAKVICLSEFPGFPTVRTADIQQVVSSRPYCTFVDASSWWPADSKKYITWALHPNLAGDNVAAHKLAEVARRLLPRQ